MKVLLLNGSPKKKFSASKFFSSILKVMLVGCEIDEQSIRSGANYKDIFKSMESADALILSVPLYVDGIPSNVLRFLKEAEMFCSEHSCHFKLYVVSNGGFIEGRQNKVHLAQYQCWCEKAGVQWGGGLGIGGGMMLQVLFYVLLVNIAIFLVNTVQSLASGAGAISSGLLYNLLQNILVWLFFNSGALLYSGMMVHAVRTSKSIKNRYTRVMFPSFLFLIVSDIFMLLMALFNGKLIFSLYKQDTQVISK